MANKLKIIVDFDVKNAQRELGKINKAVKGVGKDITQTSRELDKINKAVKGVGKDTTQTSTATQQFAASLSGLATRILTVAAAYKALSVSVRFVNQSFQTFAAMSRATKEAILISGDQLRNFTKIQQRSFEVGKKLGKAPQDIMENYKALNSILQDSRKSLSSVQDVTELLMVKVGDAGAVGVTFASIMKQWGVESDILKTKIDNIISASAWQDLNEWNSSMQEGVSTSKALGKGLDEMLVGTKLFMDAIRDSSVAGQAYKMFLNKLSKEMTPDAVRALRRLGITTSEVNTEQNNIIGVLKRLSEAKWSNIEADAVFGERAGPRVLAVLKNIQDGTIDLSKEMGYAAANTDEFNKRLNALTTDPSTKIGGLKVAFLELRVAVGEMFSPQILFWMEKFQSVLEKISEMAKTTAAGMRGFEVAASDLLFGAAGERERAQSLDALQETVSRRGAARRQSRNIANTASAAMNSVNMVINGPIMVRGLSDINTYGIGS